MWILKQGQLDGLLAHLIDTQDILFPLEIVLLWSSTMKRHCFRRKAYQAAFPSYLYLGLCQIYKNYDNVFMVWEWAQIYFQRSYAEILQKYGYMYDKPFN